MTKIKIKTTISQTYDGWNVEIYGIYPCGHDLWASSFIPNYYRRQLGDHFAMAYLFSTLAKSLEQSSCPECDFHVDEEATFIDIDTGIEYSAIYPILSSTKGVDYLTTNKLGDYNA